ncbi:hypothetical protein J6590_019705 [Homalodisca vitripennis]|nr:hypothetical protein J6590_019705 [Homalodisca vitripennis]
MWAGDVRRGLGALHATFTSGVPLHHNITILGVSIRMLHLIFYRARPGLFLFLRILISSNPDGEVPRSIGVYSKHNIANYHTPFPPGGWKKDKRCTKLSPDFYFPESGSWSACLNQSPFAGRKDVVNQESRIKVILSARPNFSR